MKKLIVLILSFGFIACNNSDSKESSSHNKEFRMALDSIKYANYIKLIDLSGPLDPYIVVTVKNLNTNEVKEVCTYSGFLEYALRKEHKKHDNQKLLRNKERYFELKDAAALNNIGFDSYTNEELESYGERIDINTLSKKILSKQDYSFKEVKDHKEFNMLAHLLFNRKILSGHFSCACMFQIIDDEYIAEQKKHLEEIKKIQQIAKQTK